MNNSFIMNMLIMDGNGVYVWMVIIILIFLLAINMYIPYKNLNKLKLKNSKKRE